MATKLPSTRSYEPQYEGQQPIYYQGEEGNPVYDTTNPNDYWEERITNIPSDWTPLTNNITPYDSWMTPEKQAYYTARDAALVPRTGDAGGMTIPPSEVSQLQKMADDAGVPFSYNNPPEYDWAYEFYDLPSNVDPLSYIPVVAAVAFGGAAASGMLAGATTAEVAAAGGAGAFEGSTLAGAGQMGSGFAGAGGLEGGAIGGGALGATEGTAPFLGAGMQAPVGTPLMPGATGAVADTAIADLIATGMAPAAAVRAVSSGGDNMPGGGGIPGIGGLFGGGGGGGGSIWDSILKGIGSPGGQLGIGGLLGGIANMYAAGKFKDIGREGARLSDPFASQRSAYQDMLMQSYTDPAFFSSNPVFQGLQQNATDQTNAQMAAMGYNMSGNQMAELTDVATQTGFNYALPFQAQLAQNAGANVNPGYAGAIFSGAAGQGIGAKMRGLGQIGAGAGGFFDLFKGKGLP